MEVDSLVPFFGWIMVEVEFKNPNVSLDLNVCFLPKDSRFPRGFNMPYKSNGRSKRVCFSHSRIQTIELSSIEGRLSELVKRVEIVRLLPSFAINRIASRLINLDFNFRGFSKNRLIIDIKNQSNKKSLAWKHLLLERYDKTFIKTRADRQYNDWIKNNEVVYKEVIESYDYLPIEKLIIRPKISIILTVYNSDINYLKQCLDSVINQTYSNWELCVVDDGSDNMEVFSFINNYAGKDSRIILHRNEKNLGFALASNKAVEISSGDFVGFLDHDDLIAKDCLIFCVNAINKFPSLGLIYTDEDKIDEMGTRYEPHFKPNWNYDLLLSQNYISHFSMIRSDHFTEVGGFRATVDGAQDYDLILRITAHIGYKAIHHIPRVLYHWRAIKGSTALDPGEKEFTTESGLTALKDFFEPQVSECPKVSIGSIPNTYKYYWPIEGRAPFVSLLIPTRDNFKVLKNCIESIINKTDYLPYEIIIINNGSVCQETRNYLNLASSHSKLKVLDWNRPFNYSAINNFAARHARGSILGLINDDVEVINKDWLREMVSHVERKNIGCVGAKLYYPNNTVQHAGVILGIGGVAGHGHKYFNRNDNGYFGRLRLVHNVSAVTGACLLVKKIIYHEAGGLETALPVAFNDVDFCLKVASLGYRNLWTPYAELYHHESISRGPDDSVRKKIRASKEVDYMRKKWGEVLDSDPYYNPNLTLTYEDFSLC
ncbi:MAG: glycosyltransferase [Pseudomonadales bacterium]|nr:glycosyltransferase [Pseudomonadales bacterium]